MYVRTTFVELSFHNSELRHTNDTKRMVCFFRLSVVISSFALSDGALMCVITSAFCIYIFVNTTQFKIQKVPHHQRIYLVYAFIIIHLYAKLVVARWREKLRHYLLKMYSNEWGGGGGEISACLENEDKENGLTETGNMLTTKTFHSRKMNNNNNTNNHQRHLSSLVLDCCLSLSLCNF